LIGTAYWGVTFYRTGYQVIRAERLMKENFTVYMSEEPRLSGDYAPSGVGEMMSGGRSTQSDRPFLTQAMLFIQRALSNGDKSSKTKQLLAQILILKGQLTSADSILQYLSQESPSAASVFNDLGVLSFTMGKWEDAALSFEKAIYRDSLMTEARYNLALTRVKMKRTTEAVAVLNEYTNQEWKGAALRLRGRLQAEDGE
jgi:Tfp pilus assembly protein PilF